MSKSNPLCLADTDCWRFVVVVVVVVVVARRADKVVGPRHCHRWTFLSPKSDDAMMMMVYQFINWYGYIQVYDGKL